MNPAIAKPFTPTPRHEKKKSVYVNASLVTGISTLERALGFLYRIVLARLIGAEGLGIYQVALSVYAVFHTLGAGGLPVCTARLVSKSKAENDPKGERAAISAGVLVSLLVTIPLSVIYFLCGKHAGWLFSDPRCQTAFNALLVALAFSCVYDVIRGSFWANKRFFSSAILELFEETLMVVFGVLLLKGAPDPFTGAKRAALASTLACLCSFVAIAIVFLAQGGGFYSPKKQFKPLLNATLPVTSVRLGNSLIASAISTLFPVALVKAGYSSAESLRLFGVVSGMALPVLMVPATLIGSLSLVLVPELSEDFYCGNRDRLYKNIGKGIHASIWIAMLLFPFFFSFGESLGLLAFASKQAGQLIRFGAPMLLPMSVAMLSTGILNSLGFEKYTFAFYFVGAAANLLCVLFLPAHCGVYAYLIGMIANFTLLSVCDLYLLCKKCPSLFHTQKRATTIVFLKGLAVLLPTCFTAPLFLSLFSKLLGDPFASIVALFTTCLFSLGLCFVVGIFTTNTAHTAEKFEKKPKILRF